jgi:hypothetical protein
MTEKKTGFLFPEAEKTFKKPKKKKRRRKSYYQTALKKVRLTKDGNKRLKILKGIARSKVPWGSEVLIHSLDDPHEKIRDFIITELGHQEKLDLNLIYQRIYSPPWYLKTGCLKILGIRKKISSIKQIEALVNDPNIEVRRTAALVLGEIGGKDALALLSKLAGDKSVFVRTAAQQALKKASQPKFS